MHCSVTLTANDFKTLHNTLCDLRSVQERLTGVINNELADRLHAVIKGFERGFAGAYAQEREDFDRKTDLFDEAKAECRFTSIWSIYEIEDLYAQHPYTGAKSLLYKDHWGDKPVSVPLVGNRWIDLWIASDHLIKESGDEHHIFIECFRPLQNDNTVLILQTGS